MIKLEPYTAEFEEEYWETVSNIIKPEIQTKIIKSCDRFLPGFFPKDTKNPFRELTLLPYSRLKEAHALLKAHNSPNAAKMRKECFYVIKKKKRRRPIYNQLYYAYNRITDSTKDGISMRVRIVKNSGLTVCPYCNRDYINCRGGSWSGAQLDHFFSRSSYPIFSVCLYNLIPVCGNCNRFKSGKDVSFASPFDDEIDWENSVTFSYEMDSIDSVRIIITSNDPVKTNISEMHIQEAYQIHDTEVKELLEKQKIYSRTQQEELKNILRHQISNKEIKQVVFGPQITAKMMKHKSLGKMMSDLHKQLGIYP